MRFYKCLFLVVFFSGISVFSQEKYKQHTVLKGETISEIAQHYNVKASEIYELNPDAVNGIKAKMVLLLPTKTKKNTTTTANSKTTNSTTTHEVLPKETLYGIAKQYKVTLEELYKVNPNLENEGLKIGQKINVPQMDSENLVSISKAEKSGVSKNNTLKEAVVSISKTAEKVTTPTEGIAYEVLPKESLYSIAKKYGIKVVDLQNANPILETTALKAGQKIVVPVGEGVNSNLVVEKELEQKEVKVEQKPMVSEQPKATPVVMQTVESKSSKTEITHEVLPKESMYSIAKQYGITLSDLQNANPALENKTLRVGQKIVIPNKKEANPSLVVAQKETKKESKNTIDSQSISEDKKPEIEYSREVLLKETKYGIAKEYGLTVAELEKQNPSIAKKLIVGSVLKIRSSKVIENKVAIDEAVVVKEESVNKSAADTTSQKVYDAAFVDQLILTASENIGTRYRSGGTTKEGFDCSGLMCFTFGAYDVKLPRSSIEMASYGSRVDTENAQKGDLIFFKTNGRGRINHVGMVIEVLEGEIKFIHSSTSNGVIISSTKESYYERCFAQVNRVL